MSFARILEKQNRFANESSFFRFRALVERFDPDEFRVREDGINA